MVSQNATEDGHIESEGNLKTSDTGTRKVTHDELRTVDSVFSIAR